ncbi:uncharacterized protein [Palaemon carinicauda]|uniref:uncharacterized protein n=1 Tax=Palaemon carinicauda TaxID=392227 RepID=UPI0035B69741
MRIAATVSSFTLLVLVSTCICFPTPADKAIHIPTIETIMNFIPTREEIAALADHTTPAQGVPPPHRSVINVSFHLTMPPAVAALIEKYKKATAAFTPSTSAV